MQHLVVNSMYEYKTTITVMIKVVPMLTEATSHEDVQGSGDMAPRFLNAVTFTPGERASLLVE
jgi:hypothetical protein